MKIFNYLILSLVLTICLPVALCDSKIYTSAWEIVNDGDILIVDMADKGFNINMMSIYTSEYFENLQLTYQQIDKPAVELKGMSIDNYYKVELNTRVFEAVRIFFTVDENWLTSNNIAPEKVKMYLYTNGSWQELETQLENGTYVAYTNKLGIVAIAGPKDTAVANAVEEEPVETESATVNEKNKENFITGLTAADFKPEKSALIAGFSVFVIVIAAGFIYQNFIKGIKFEVSEEKEEVKRKPVSEEKTPVIEEKKSSYEELDRKLEDINKTLRQLK